MPPSDVKAISASLDWQIIRIFRLRLIRFPYFRGGEWNVATYVVRSSARFHWDQSPWRQQPPTVSPEAPSNVWPGRKLDETSLSHHLPGPPIELESQCTPLSSIRGLGRVKEWKRWRLVISSAFADHFLLFFYSFYCSLCCNFFMLLFTASLSHTAVYFRGRFSFFLSFFLSFSSCSSCSSSSYYYYYYLDF